MHSIKTKLFTILFLCCLLTNVVSASQINLATQVKNILPVSNGGTGANNASAARASLAIPNLIWGNIGGTLANQTDLATALSGKQGTLTLTTTGSGAASLIGTTLNIPTNSGGSASWGAITGTLSNQTDLATALSGKQGTLTLTTSGSGAASLIGTTLNIPTNSTTWGAIGGTLSNQTDLMTALNGKQASGTYLTGVNSPLTLTGTTVNCPTATSSVPGCLAAADWSTFNGKQAALTLTTTGSGAASLIGTTLNIPTNSTTWGTISGTLSNQTDLATALSGKQGTLTLTTSGSGAASLIGTTLNIPTTASLALNLSGTPTLPSGTNCVTQTTGDASANCATDAFVAAAVASAGGGNFSGPNSSVNNDIIVFNGVTGHLGMDSGKILPSGAVVGTTDIQALTGKTVDGVTPTTFGFLDATSSIQTQLNGKQASGTYLTGVNSPLTLTGTTVNCPTATSSVPGCLAAADWTTFNGKQAALGYTPLNAANNLTDVANAATSLSNLGGVPVTRTVNGLALSTNISLTATNIGLGNVANAAQTLASIVPNTAPTAGQELVGNAGGTAYAPVTMSGDCTRSSTGAITCTKTNGSSFGTAATANTTAFDAAGAAATAQANAETYSSNASNLLNGTITAARLPAALSSSTSVNGTNIPSGATLVTTTVTSLSNLTTVAGGTFNTGAFSPTYVLPTATNTILGGILVPASAPLLGSNGSSALVSLSVLPTTAEPAHTGDVTNTAGSLSMTVKGINGTILSGLSTGYY